ncbi:hypothetical protein ES705_31433 [subsurface metagenome]
MEQIIKDYEVLPKVVQPRGTGIANLSSTLIKREGRLCMYERSDNVFEVFLVVVRPAVDVELFGKSYPAREVYPGNEDFGSIAWCYSKFKYAEEMYNNLKATL